jgi:S-adenosylmethionine synthetase
MSRDYIFSSESVTEGHPDKVCDSIADAVLDAHIEQDPKSRVACEVLCKERHVIIAGEIRSSARVDIERIARETIRDIGYADPERAFNAEGVRILNLLGVQAADIAQGVDNGLDQGAGDQGLVFGFATTETTELMPLPIHLAHRITRQLAYARKVERIDWLRPDAKAQVSVRYVDGLPVEVTDAVVSTQHARDTPQDHIHSWVNAILLPAALGSWYRPTIRTFINPTGAFAIGGPEGDCGVTGRKIIVDTYGGFARHGGGAFSGKDPSKVDRSAAYFARYVARQIVKRQLAATAEIQISYAIGVAQPVSIKVDTWGTGDYQEAEAFARTFDYRPAAITAFLGLERPIYCRTTNYGHFGKPDLPWEM